MAHCQNSCDGLRLLTHNDITYHMAQPASAIYIRADSRAFLSRMSLTNLNKSITRDPPLGTPEWAKETALKMGLESSLRPRERPKKGTGHKFYPSPSIRTTLFSIWTLVDTRGVLPLAVVSLRTRSLWHHSYGNGRSACLMCLPPSGSLSKTMPW